MTEYDRINYLNYCCGMLMGTLISISDQVPNNAKDRIDDCLLMVKPMLAKVYEFQAKEDRSATDVG